jgi:hypothetical protein
VVEIPVVPPIPEPEVPQVPVKEDVDTKIWEKRQNVKEVPEDVLKKVLE